MSKSDMIEVEGTVVEVLPNTSATPRSGIVHLTTMASVGGISVNSVQRIKLDITQLGK